MSPFELTGMVTAIANALACKLTAPELALVASIFVQLGDTLATLATCKGACEATKGDS